jgi:hypothetical protein
MPTDGTQVCVMPTIIDAYANILQLVVCEEVDVQSQALSE